MKLVELKNSLKPIENSTLVDRVEANLVEFLVSRKLQAGDSLPKETDIAQTLGVSRTVVREALLRLRMVGLVESRKHRGAVITNPDVLSLFEKVMNPAFLSKETLKDLYEIRLVLEMGTADLIFERMKEKDIEELFDIVADEPEVTDENYFDRDFEYRFHSRLYQIGSNNTLIRLQLMFFPVFYYVHSSDLLHKPMRVKRYVSHKGLVEILKHGNPDLFRNAMRSHLETHFQRILIKENSPPA
ncbi:MAG TPA: GntR family transcriptional regulator [Anseongella sp.]|nr:GntR family transcriptional regulator [Anseongella sp.]